MKKNFSELSYYLTKEIDKTVKKNMGIFFTPIKTIKKTYEVLNSKIKNIKTILEPSCGSCEYIKYFIENYNHKDVHITGIELNKAIYNEIIKKKFHNTNIINANFIEWETDKKYDLIIGNPPYFVMKKKEINKKYYTMFDGRPNIFMLFIIKSLKLLNENGYLSFILPKNFMNSLYYDKLRRYIYDNYKIYDIIDCSDDKYIETQQDTIIFIIQKIKKKSKKNNNKFIVNNKNKYTIFNTKENIVKINKLYYNATNLNDLGFNVKVGNIVWNQCKDILTNNSIDTRLIYNSDIVNNKLSIKKYKNKDKKNYINKEGKTGILLVLNRGYGTGKYSFDYCLIDTKEPYLIENHLICIESKTDIDNNILKEKYTKIINSWNNKKTKEFIKLYFSNNAINTTELQYILPIYIT
jgi:DNA (cytosine-5)-methyltransferase 1